MWSCSLTTRRGPPWPNNELRRLAPSHSLALVSVPPPSPLSWRCPARPVLEACARPRRLPSTPDALGRSRFSSPGPGPASRRPDSVPAAGPHFSSPGSGLPPPSRLPCPATLAVAPGRMLRGTRCACSGVAVVWSGGRGARHGEGGGFVARLLGLWWYSLDEGKGFGGVEGVGAGACGGASRASSGQAAPSDARHVELEA